MSALRTMTRRRLGSLEVRPGVMQRYNRRIQAAMAGTVWTAGCHNYFRTERGKVVTQLPYSGGRYWLRTRFLRPWQYRMQRATAPRADARDRVRSRAHVRAGRCGRVCRRCGIRRTHDRAAAATAREARRRARSARPRRRPRVDAAARRRITRRPRRRVARTEARRDLRARQRGRRRHVQDVGEGRPPPDRRRARPPLHGAHPEDQPPRHRHDRPRAVPHRPDVEAGAPRSAVDREARGRVGHAFDRLVAANVRGSVPRSRATSSRWRCAACSPAT